MDDLSSPPAARSAVSTFFLRLGQRYQLLLGMRSYSKERLKIDKTIVRMKRSSMTVTH